MPNSLIPPEIEPTPPPPPVLPIVPPPPTPTRPPGRGRFLKQLLGDFLIGFGSGLSGRNLFEEQTRRMQVEALSELRQTQAQVLPEDVAARVQERLARAGFVAGPGTGLAQARAGLVGEQAITEQELRDVREALAAARAFQAEQTGKRQAGEAALLEEVEVDVPELGGKVRIPKEAIGSIIRERIAAKTRGARARQPPRFTEGERRRVAETVMGRLGIPLPLLPNSPRFRAQQARIQAKIDQIVRAGGDPSQTFEQAFAAFEKAGRKPTLDDLLQSIRVR